MIYIFREKPSNGARDLAEELCMAGVRARRIRRLPAQWHESDRLICWGEGLGNHAPIIPALNRGLYDNKLNDALVLKAAGVATIEAHRTRPEAPPPQQDTRFIRADDLARDFRPLIQEHLQDRALERLAAIQAILNEPAPSRAQEPTWIGRRYHHVGGNDLLNPPSVPDYWVKKESIVEEYRIHCFKGKSIRAGKKIPRENAHPWIRSFDGNWIIAYEGFKSTKEMRELAASACAALELDFAAVDLAKRADGSLFVLECNRAPGVEGNTTVAYAEAISKWAQDHQE